MPQVHFGGAHEVDELLSGHPHPNNFQLVEQSMAYVPTQALSEMGQQFAQMAQQAYEAFTDSFAARKATAAARAMKHQWQTDTIRPLETIDALQHAPNCMVRYLMAEPNIRWLYHQDQADGYRDRYVDTEPGQIGEDHYDYRRVMNGMVVIDEEDEDGEPGWHFTEWCEDLDEGDRELYFVEQVDILRSWQEIAERAINGGDDPTSKWNSSL